MNRWSHPVSILAMGGVTVFMMICFFAMFDVLCPMGNEEHIAGYVFWGTVWLIPICAALVGFAINVSAALRCGVGRIGDLERLKDLSGDEAEELHQWMTDHLYDLEDLKGLWGEK